MLSVKTGVVSLLALGAAGCQLSGEVPPPLAGPSEQALSLSVSAVPDLMAQDGQSRSLVTVVARGPNGRLAPGISLKLSMSVDGASQDYGTLGSKWLSTGADGQATTMYQAPPAQPPTATDDRTVEIAVLPVGADYAAELPRTVAIRLVRAGVVLPPNPPLVPAFFFSPLQPHEAELVQFDATAAGGTIVTYAWTFGDGTGGSGVRTTHRYAVAGTYNATLTITDDRGARVSSPPAPVTVLAAADPIAAFVFSPADPRAGDTVYFDAARTFVPPGRSILEFSWNFGDGSVGMGPAVSHHYGKPGTYVVTLTATDSAGRKGVASQSVQVR